MDLWGVASRADVQLVCGALLATGLIVVLAKTTEQIERVWIVGAFWLALGNAYLLFHTNSPFAWGGLIGLVVGSVWAYRRSSRIKAQRDDEVAEFARRTGLMFATIRTDIPMHLLDTLSGYDGLSAVRVISGTWHDTPIITGEYRYAHYTSDDPPSYGVLRFGLAFMPVPAPLIVIRRHDALTRLRDRVKRRYVSFGDAAFDRRFRVTCDVPGEARVVLAARVRAWLAENDRYGSYLIGGHDIVVLVPCRHDIQEVTALLDWLRQFRAMLEKEMAHAVG